MRAISLVPVFLILTVLGCKSEPTLIGNWTTTANGSELEVEFKPDHTSVGMLKSPFGTVVINSTWSLEGDKFKTTVKSASLTGGTPDLTARVNAQVEKLLKGKEQTGTLVFTSADDAQITSGSATQVLKRAN